jgi:site-specific DNA-methyltransferase (adenine-specific)
VKSDPVSKDEWATPKPLFDWCSHYFNFSLDAAASAENALCEKFYTKEQNALKKDWKKGAKGGDVWLNHPYSMNETFIKKMKKESDKGVTICNLGPADTSCRYFELYYKYCSGIYLILGRVKFKGASHAATFSSGIYVFGKDKLGPAHNPHGRIVTLLKVPPRIRGGVR